MPKLALRFEFILQPSHLGSTRRWSILVVNISSSFWKYLVRIRLLTLIKCQLKVFVHSHQSYVNYLANPCPSPGFVHMHLLCSPVSLVVFKFTQILPIKPISCRQLFVSQKKTRELSQHRSTFFVEDTRTKHLKWTVSDLRSVSTRLSRALPDMMKPKTQSIYLYTDRHNPCASFANIATVTDNAAVEWCS